jgi:hypothetical protein
MKYSNHVFDGERVPLSGNVFHGCVFKGCELVFDGERSPTFNDNEFIDSTFVFSDAAAKTLYFLANIYHAGKGGEEIVEKMLNDLRSGAIHGREWRTGIPSTADHSLH